MDPREHGEVERGRTLEEIHLALARGDDLDLSDAEVAEAWRASPHLILVLDASSGEGAAWLAAAIACARAAAEAAGDRAFDADLDVAERATDRADVSARHHRLNTTARDPQVEPVGYAVERAVRFALAVADALTSGNGSIPPPTGLRPSPPSWNVGVAEG